MKKFDTRKRHQQLSEAGYHLIKMFLRPTQYIIGIGRVLLMTMVLPTFPERKVGRTEGDYTYTNHINLSLFPSKLFLFQMSSLTHPAINHR
ncbi:hypothetical protein CDG60_16860 [Acinetobacter chinensis]|uniref:Uncharacterized protein n=1 Tax=Acinetobacter chinensis TaxID=2004650 RepID=A0A3B7M6N8_9GAMM|nr:hypothetical protein CDG60_16860 [Acinetobacter chinensis]